MYLYLLVAGSSWWSGKSRTCTCTYERVRELGYAVLALNAPVRMSDQTGRIVSE